MYTNRHTKRIPSVTGIFSLSPASNILNTPSFTFILSKIKIYHLSLFTTTQAAFDIADPGSMPDACHTCIVINLVNVLAYHEFIHTCSSLVRVPSWYLGSHGLKSWRAFRFFSLCHACIMLNIPSFKWYVSMWVLYPCCLFQIMITAFIMTGL